MRETPHFDYSPVDVFASLLLSLLMSLTNLAVQIICNFTLHGPALDLLHILIVAELDHISI